MTQRTRNFVKVHDINGIAGLQASIPLQSGGLDRSTSIKPSRLKMALGLLNIVPSIAKHCLRSPQCGTWGGAAPGAAPYGHAQIGTWTHSGTIPIPSRSGTALSAQP